MKIEEAINFLDTATDRECSGCCMEEKCDEAGIGLCKQALEIVRSNIIPDVLGKTVYVSPSGRDYYKAIILGYGAYSADPEYKTYCVKVIKENGVGFVDYFESFIEEDEFKEWEEERLNDKHPFGFCRKCGLDFNSELINDYNMKYCIRCGHNVDTAIV